MSSEVFQDEAVILRVKNWQTADKYAVCFCREHGKIPFVAYGAAYPPEPERPPGPAFCPSPTEPFPREEGGFSPEL